MAATTTRSLKQKPKTKVNKVKKLKIDSSKDGTESKKPMPNLSAMLMLGSELLSTGQFNDGLPSFVTRGLDAEQIWQQLELRNDHKLAMVASTRAAARLQAAQNRIVSNLPSKKQQIADISEEDQEKQGEKSADENDSDSSDEGNDMLNSIKRRLEESHDDDEDDDFFNRGESEEEEDNDVDFDFELEREIAGAESDDEGTNKSKLISSKKGVQKKVPKRTTVVDDKFFKLADMEEFLESEDAREERRMKREEKDKKEGSEDESDDDDDEDELIDMFGEEESDDDPSSTAKYADFFDPPEEDGPKPIKEKKGKKSSHEKVDEEEDDEEEEAKQDVDDSEGEFEESLEMKDGDDDVEEDLQSNDDDDQDDEKMEEEGEEDNEEEDDKAATELGTGKKVSFAKDLFDSDDEDESVGMSKSKDEIKSTFELRQEKLRQRAAEMEDLSLKEPSWELTGEATASRRPENSLLETVLDFQHTNKAAPVITDDTTKSLEDYIKQRIKDKTFDDVERKEKPKEDVLEFKKRIVLDQEKSKMSLGELYEQEFLKQQQKNEDEVKEDPECEGIEKDLKQLFKQLDALSNFRYTPLKPGTEVKIIVNTPAITMEEVAPVATADSELLAPEEVHGKKRGDLKADDERDSTDKKRARRQKKKEKRERKKAKESREKIVEKMKPGLGNKYSKEKALKQLEQIAKQDKSVSLIQGERQQKLGSSTSFFTQLQEEVQTNARAKKAKMEATKKKKKVTDASKLML